MKKLKKTLCLFLTLTMCLGLVNLTALAADGDPWTDPSEFGSDQEVTPSETPVENGTQTEWEYEIEAKDDDPATEDVDESHGDIKVEGIETVTETEGTNAAGVSGTTTTTEGKETITETTEEDLKVTEGEPELGEDDPVWTPSTDEQDGWKDVTTADPDPDPSADPDPDPSEFTTPDPSVKAPLDTTDSDLGKDMTLEQKPAGDPSGESQGTLEGTVNLGTVDKDELISEDVKDLTKDDETGTYTSTDGKTTATVTEVKDADGKTTITVEKIVTENVEYGEGLTFNDAGEVEITEEMLPEGAKAVTEGGKIVGYEIVEETVITNEAGETVTTTKITTTMLTITNKTAEGNVTQKRTVTTTTYKIDKDDKTLDVKLDDKLTGDVTEEHKTESSDKTEFNAVDKMDGSTTTVTANEDLDAIANKGYELAGTDDYKNLDDAAVNAVINAVLLDKVNPPAEGAAQSPRFEDQTQQELYEALMGEGYDAEKNTLVDQLPTEPAEPAEPAEPTPVEQPEITNATVKVVDIKSEDGTTSSGYKATVNFTVSALPNEFGDLALTLTDGDGNEFTQTVPKGNLTKNEDGTYAVSVEVQLSGASQNLTLNLTGSTTERTVYVVNAEVPGTPGTPGGDTTPQDPIIFDKDKVDDTLDEKNFEADNKNFEDAKGEDGKEYHASFSYNPKDGEKKFDTKNGAISDAQKAYLDKLVFESPEGNKCITIKAPADMDIPVGYIVVKGGNAMPVVYNVGTLKAGTSITVYAPPKEGGGYYGVSHVIFGDIDDPTEPTKPTPGQSGTYVRVDEIQKKLDLSGKLDLTLNDILVGKKVETQDQEREGFATWSRQDKTEQVTVETMTVREWNRTTFTPDENRGEPPRREDPPEENIPDEDPPTTNIPDEEPPLVEIPDEEPPLAEEPPVVDIPDEEPPLAEEPPVVEIPNEEPPLAEWPPVVDIPEEDVPMADVPQTGDISLVWYATTVVSATGLALLLISNKKKEQED